MPVSMVALYRPNEEAVSDPARSEYLVPRTGVRSLVPVRPVGGDDRCVSDVRRRHADFVPGGSGVRLDFLLGG